MSGQGKIRFTSARVDLGFRQQWSSEEKIGCVSAGMQAASSSSADDEREELWQGWPDGEFIVFQQQLQAFLSGALGNGTHDSGAPESRFWQTEDVGDVEEMVPSGGWVASLTHFSLGAEPAKSRCRPF
jgi:hypothetical protein